MTFFRLLLRNLAYHWRGNLAVFLGIALGSAVLTGALLVGDSLRGSLKALTLDQLGWVEEAMVPGRFFRAKLAKEISAQRGAPVLMLQGNASNKNADGEARIPRVTVLGIDASFWPDQPIPLDADFWSSEEKQGVVNQTLANSLGVKVGDTFKLHLQKADQVPREMLLGNRKDTVETLDLKVRSILKDEGMARFSLKPTPQPVSDAFVPIRVLQKTLDLVGRANALLIAKASTDLQADLQKHLTLDDWGLRLRTPKDRALALMHFLDPKDIDGGNLKRLRWSVRLADEEAALAQKNGESLLIEQKKAQKLYWRSRVPEALAQMAQKNDGILTKELAITFYEVERSYDLLESRRMVLEPAIVETVHALEARRHDRYADIAIYLADGISDGKLTVPYAIIAALDSFPKHADPLERKDPILADQQILFVDWPGLPLRLKPGKSVTVRYYSPDEKNHLALKDEKFTVKDVVKLTGKLDDPDLTPEFPGITDQADMANWQNPPFPYNKNRIKKGDENERYWQRYRTTPKAYVSMTTARKLWGSRFGDTTSIMIRRGKDSATPFPQELLAALQPEQGGFVFQKVREQALNASSGATDFGVLFLAFSFFLIVAALLLVGLLVRLNLDRRAAEIGLLLALGWTHRRVRWLLLCEGAILAGVGALIGLGGAMLYAHLMLQMLAANWPGGAGLNFLRLHIDEHSLIHGYAISLFVSVLTLYWALRVLGKLSPRSLLSGETAQTTGLADEKPGWSRWLIAIGIVGALLLALFAKAMPSQMAEAGSFFGSGALLLTACLAGVWQYFKRSSRASTPQPSLGSLGLRNAGRHAVRSVLTVGLLASASFLIVAVESFHKDTDQHFQQKSGGSGGFALFAEGSVPVYEDLNEVSVRRRLGLDTPEMREVTVYPCRVQAGDDASCLNLYKPLKPRVMGVSNAMIARGGFHFGASKAKSDDEKNNPWLLLQNKDDDAIPAIIDANTAQWILKVKVDDIVEVNDDQGKSVKLHIVALLDESIFQSEILIAEDNFLKLFPRQEGFSFLLIDADDADAEKLSTIEKQLNKSLADINMDVQTTASRLQAYLAVENTYLATFQALGGLGLMLGAAGLAIVLLRGVWERRAELALLQALGFRSAQLAWLVLAENAFLLVLGLASGTVSALLAVAPHLVGAGAHVLWLRIAGLLVIVLAAGLITAALAVWSTLKTPVLTALRRE